MLKIKEKEIKELENKIRFVLFSEELKKGGKCMCAIFPSNGVYVASGVVREFNRRGQAVTDMYDYFREMKMGNYHDLGAALQQFDSMGL